MSERFREGSGKVIEPVTSGSKNAKCLFSSTLQVRQPSKGHGGSIGETDAEFIFGALDDSNSYSPPTVFHSWIGDIIERIPRSDIDKSLPHVPSHLSPMFPGEKSRIQEGAIALARRTIRKNP